MGSIKSVHPVNPDLADWSGDDRRNHPVEFSVRMRAPDFKDRLPFGLIGLIILKCQFVLPFGYRSQSIRVLSRNCLDDFSDVAVTVFDE